MTKSQLARRMGVSSSTVAELERSEVRETITLASLRRLAKGLDCRVVYALVPNGADSLEALVRDRAEAARASGDSETHPEGRFRGNDGK